MEFNSAPTGERRRQRVKVDFSVTKDNEIMGSALYDPQSRYVLTCTAHTEFWSLPHELERKQRHAEIMAKSYMFRDMIPLVREIIADSDCDEVRETALKLLDKMTKDKT